MFQNTTAEAPASYAASVRQLLQAGADPHAILLELILRLRTQSREVSLDYARAFLDSGLPGIVAAILQDACLRWPRDAELFYWLGNALRMCGDLAGAEAAFRSALEVDPANDKAGLALAHMLRDAGRLEAAADTMMQLNDQLPASVANTLRSVQFLESCRRFAQAAQLCERQLLLTPEDPQLLFFAGQMALLLGDFALARQRLIAALDHGLDVSVWSGVWLFLSSARRYSAADDADLERFRSAWNDTRLSEPARASAAFASGKAYDDLRLYAEAASAFREANALARSRHTWSAQDWQRFVAAQIGGAALPQLEPRSEEPIIPVFVVGLPRSGTTLVAELLGRHPQVCNRGERSWIPFLDQRLTAENAQRKPEALRRAAELYLTHLRQDDAPARWYIDKNPLNFRHLGLIAAMLPQARIIYCSRDRRDTALSIWCQFFEHQDNNYAYDWHDIAAFAAGEEALMAHWSQALKLPLYTADYQRLVEQPEQVLHELGDFLGLPQQELLHAPSKADTAIATSSVWQARQPVYRSSVARWRAYAPYIPELDLFGS